MRRRLFSKPPITARWVISLRLCLRWSKRLRKRKLEIQGMKRCVKNGGPGASAAVVCVALACLAGCKKPVSQNVAATVNGRPITYAELDRAIAAQFPTAPPKTNADQTTQIRLEALRALI